MPIYEFYCQNCKKTIEKEFKIKDCPRVIECECGKEANKIMSVPAKPEPIYYNKRIKTEGDE